MQIVLVSMEKKRSFTNQAQEMERSSVWGWQKDWDEEGYCSDGFYIKKRVQQCSGYGRCKMNVKVNALSPYLDVFETFFEKRVDHGLEDDEINS